MMSTGSSVAVCRTFLRSAIIESEERSDLCLLTTRRTTEPFTSTPTRSGASRPTPAPRITPGELVRKAFEQYEVTHNRTRSEGEVTAFDVLSRTGLIGCLKSAPDTPTDLATNPNHMHGFGCE